MTFTVKLLTGQTTGTQAASGQAVEVAKMFADFVATAATSLDIAIYHFHLRADDAPIVTDALNAAVAKGVAVRIAYFDEPKKKTPAGEHLARMGGDANAPSVFEGLSDGVQKKPIVGLDLDDLPEGTTREPVEGGGHLMHSKYMIADGQAVWMGSANFTTEAWSVQDNNIVVAQSADLAHYYQTDFDDLWRTGRIAGSGKDDTGSIADGGDTLDVDFSPGDGRTIDAMIADHINAATGRVTIASMVISSSLVLTALTDAIGRGVSVAGVYDGPQMANIMKAWKRAESGAHAEKSEAKDEAWTKLEGVLVGKKSMPFNPQDPNALYNFMHNKAVAIDGALVVTGSFNFSENATRNAENVLTIHDAAIAGRYEDYISSLASLFGKTVEGT